MLFSDCRPVKGKVARPLKDPMVIVGSGAAGVHCALTLLQAGCRVRMLDVGQIGQSPPLPRVPVSELKSQLPDSQGYFLGANAKEIRLPGDDGEYYALPPSKSHVVETGHAIDPQSSGFSPLTSFARGGFAEAWTGGCYPFDDNDLRNFPLDFSGMRPFYEKVSRRIGVSGADDLVSLIPFHDGIQDPLPLDRHSELLLRAYQKNRKHRSPGIHLGHARSSVISQAIDERSACSSLGRCLWGCPTSSFYVPSLTLAECQAFENFDYHPGLRVSHAVCDSERRVKAIQATDTQGETHRFDVGTLVLAAGTLSTSEIYLKSLYHAGDSNPVLTGLMDNRQIHIPFVTPAMFGQPITADAYQYHRLAMVVEDTQLPASAHGQLTTLKAAMTHPILQRLPIGLRSAIRLFRNVRSGMGLLNLSFPDTRRRGNQIRLTQQGKNDQNSSLQVVIDYCPPAAEHETHRRVKRKVRRFMKQLGCRTFGFWNSTRDMGASIHYAGTIPMSATAAPRTVSLTGNSHDFSNLWIVDASVFPSLPAKSLTLTIMANAVRTAGLIMETGR